VSAKVNRTEPTRSDFRTKAPTGTSTVRGTDFSVSYDRRSKTTRVWVREGTVVVDPVKPSFPVLVKAGKEIEVTPKDVGPVTRIRSRRPAAAK
jgi:ferric-dicitrate binding protein FerR (iron transport regulator)